MGDSVNGFYEKRLMLRHHEGVMKVNYDTGEVVDCSDGILGSNSMNASCFFNPGGFNKQYSRSWDYLLENLNNIELGIISRMSMMAKMRSNSLAPLNDRTSMSKLGEVFGVDRRIVGRIFDKFLKMGVYAEFKFGDGSEIRHYWVLNPFISFNGKTIDKSLVELFSETLFFELSVKNKSDVF